MKNAHWSLAEPQNTRDARWRLWLRVRQPRKRPRWPQLGAHRCMASTMRRVPTMRRLATSLKRARKVGW